MSLNGTKIKSGIQTTLGKQKKVEMKKLHAIVLKDFESFKEGQILETLETDAFKSLEKKGFVKRLPLEEKPKFRVERDRKFMDTGKKIDIPVSARNRRLVTILQMEGVTSVKDLARRTGVRPQTVLTELKYLGQKGFVREVG